MTAGYLARRTPSRPCRLLVAAVAATLVVGYDPAMANAAHAGAPASVAPSTAVHVDNPYEAGRGYVDPQWKARADAEPGGDRVSSTPTAVWLDRIVAIEGSQLSSRGPMGLADHLDAALAQGATYAQFVLYDLPGRDCAALASNGGLGSGDLGRYRTEYIDPIATIMGDPRYAGLRIITIIEPNSLPNLILNVGNREFATDTCDTMKANGGYVAGIQYALDRLHAIGNVYTYLDASRHDLIGWKDDLEPVADLIATTVRGTTAGLASVDGIITNTAGYAALHEPYLTVTAETRKSKWIDWNDYVDEGTFAPAFRQKLVSLGFDPGLGILIDTSRNGWGGPRRPTAASTASDVDTRVDGSRVDRRIKNFDWCNQKGAGLGERPQASPAPNVDAYVWAKPPGESDGSSSPIDNDEGMRFDQMCDPTYHGWPPGRDQTYPTGALPNAPIYGAWFSTQFRELMTNAYPPLQP